ncbi:ATP-binding protein [Nocardioides sp. B-3]|uniref:ATP-binding protein n=1 Tax=Nocardioides sp. B-3 TaxID=2895565 RepID=UPI002153442D|nr:ATP-binding protein [Nocardioides sp. B-3]UUZ61731.1 hypothetical protein LP418_17815 [Nocardioides sp. B-3]
MDHAESRDIHILVGGDEHSAAIAVRDHGVGLGPGESAMVFNRFWRADPARARTSGGTGLGLSISPGGHPPARRLAPGPGPTGRGLAVPADAAAPAEPAVAPQSAPAGAPRRQGDRMTNVPARLSLTLCAAFLATACVRMPSEGPVTEVDTEASGTTTPGTYDYDPQPPQEGETPTEIVAGFLEAMKATPSRTNVASQFLTPGARQRWAPDQKIVTYADFDDPVGDQLVTVPLFGIEEYDSRGARQQSRDGAVVDFDLTLQGRPVAHRRPA